MSEITNRAEALKASKKKWSDILERFNQIHNDVESNCGFCDLAVMKALELDQLTHVLSRCKHCEPDAKKLCEDYITDAQFITGPLVEAWNRTNELLNKLKALPATLKEK